MSRIWGAVSEGRCGDGVVYSLFANGVAVFAVDAVEAAVTLHSVGSAEHLVDEDLVAFEKRVLVAAGDLRDDDVAGEGAFLGAHRIVIF